MQVEVSKKITREKSGDMIYREPSATSMKYYGAEISHLV
jgi:hypothetical protein